VTLRLPTIEYHQVKDLIPWEGNPRVHDAEQLRLLAKSIRHHGLARLIVIQKNTRRILAGHGCHEALMEMGNAETPIPCVAVECSLEDAEAYTVADNRLSDRSEWSLPALRDVLGELDNGQFDVEWTGYTQAELKKLFGPEIKVPDLELGDVMEADPEFYELQVAPGTVKVTGPDKAKAKRIARALATVLSAEVSE